MDYYSGAPEPTDYDNNVVNNGGRRINYAVIFLIIFAVIISILIVVFFLTNDGGKYEYEQLDDDSYLAELQVNGGVLSPEFTKETFKYDLYADSDYVSFSCKLSSDKSKLQGCDESIEVTAKETVHAIRVEAEDGNVSKYYITIIKSQ